MIIPDCPRIFTESEWHNQNYEWFRKSDAVREEWRSICEEVKHALREREVLTQSSQELVTELIQNRAREIFQWKKEFQKTIDGLTSETENVIQHKKQLENALNANQLALMINKECFILRRQRIGSDLADDTVQFYLLKEEDLLLYVKSLLLKHLTKIDDQIIINKNIIAKLEQVWSDKWEAYKIDSFCAHLNNQSNESLMYYPYWEELPERWITHESWLLSTKESLMQCSNEKVISRALCKAVNTFLKTSSYDIHDHQNFIDLALTGRITDMARVIYQLKQHLKILTEDISLAEKTVSNLKFAMKEKEQPLKIAQTRLHYRYQRPNTELVQDPAHDSLIKEIQQITESIDLLKKQIINAEQTLAKLVELRKGMEKELSNKEHALCIDKERVTQVRQKFPSQFKLMGYE